eukprot:CAMPEP_0170253192 /NCGR_PEP_ID=MMETSP0116_2-20130129/26435_1 /TAXON_ID=400756 /ORGANISM="Durinskia baltica, Strain CSIRO CS-38" /LENGTH=45 /DNA_ID= /DNA_START= /DNA_END= /DNA_ORIENTATION=
MAMPTPSSRPSLLKFPLERGRPERDAPIQGIAPRRTTAACIRMVS